ncbi:MAG: hypothetical protein ACRDS1_04600 [Pseudonocardiaceae bacterium]
MPLEVWISVAAAAVAVVGVAAAWWQAREARRQVREARRSATAAEEKVELMRRQHEMYQTEQAKLVTVTVDHSRNSTGTMGLVITNGSEHHVGWPRVEAIGTARPPRWGEQVPLVDDDGDEYEIEPRAVLQKHKPYRVPFLHFNADNQPVNLAGVFMAGEMDRYIPRADDVTITFDMFGVRWRRVGNVDPVPCGPASSNAAGLVST